VDTGVDTGHPDLDGRIRAWRNFVDQDSQAFRHDVHGTAVAAVIAATANNGIGMVGVAPDAQILALRACTEGLQGGLCTTFTLAKSIDYAVATDVDVINLSLAGPADPLLQRLVRAGLQKGIVFVGAVHINADAQFPAHVDGVIAAAETQNQYAAEIPNASIRAPGRKVLSAKPGTDYDFYSGSSLSAAHVSGLIALLKERKPHISAEEIASILRSSSPRLRSTASSVDACRSVASLIGVAGCP
jgi:subtilisin family serine protease